jgi:RNA polymerase sigma-70 factor (ECF subfamily)
MIDFSKYNDQELSYLMKSDDKKIAKAAFDLLYNRYSSKIYTFCIRYLRDKNLAQDIFQEVFIKFFKIVNTREHIENVGGYLQKIARNLCINHSQNEKHNEIPFEKSKLIFRANSLEIKQEREIINMALNMLPDHLREVIILKEFLNYTYDEIAITLDINRNSVGVTLHRAKQKLKELLEPYFGELIETQGEKYEY